jgi:hypothetical protein
MLTLMARSADNYDLKARILSADGKLISALLDIESAMRDLRVGLRISIIAR